MLSISIMLTYVIAAQTFPMCGNQLQRMVRNVCARNGQTLCKPSKRALNNVIGIGMLLCFSYDFDIKNIQTTRLRWRVI